MRRTLPRFLTEAEMIAVATHPDPRTLVGARDRAILGVLCAAGLRVSELCQLLVGDVHDALVFVRRGKFGAQRWVPISRRCQAAIGRYLALQPAGAQEPLFRTHDGQALTRRCVHRIVAEHQVAVGVPTGVHLMRSSAATRWLNRGLSLPRVQAILGHVNIATTALYLGVATDALTAEYQRAVDGAP